ncbi:protein PERCC1 [Betta splendens]|uniref:Protein PERCC1 n=1 Tax=Betta splendens TaxID=158456 RepID=A0A6P7NP02_BETSP|nr:protein PERCC1 [Betta splendens]
MATGIIRNFLVQAPTSAYFPLMFQHSPCKEDRKDETLEARGEEEEEDEGSEAPEEEEEGLEEVFLNPPPCALDLTKQLLGFADLISRDVQRYFGRTSGDQDACDVYGNSEFVTTSGRLRYYDDLLRIARAGAPEDHGSSSARRCEERGAAAADAGGLGPLAELFDQNQNQSRGRPMTKRHLPLSFWTEPVACSAVGAFSSATFDLAAQDSAHAHYNTLPHHSAHALDGTQPDFSDLLANWDPNPELAHTLTENTHMQH